MVKAACVCLFVPPRPEDGHLLFLVFRSNRFCSGTTTVFFSIDGVSGTGQPASHARLDERSGPGGVPMPSYHNVPRQPFAGRSGNTMHSGMGGKPKPVDSVKSLNDIALRDAAVRCAVSRSAAPSALPAARRRACPRRAQCGTPPGAARLPLPRFSSPAPV